MGKTLLSLLLLSLPATAEDKTILTLKSLRATDGAPIAGGDVSEWTEETQRGTQARFYTAGGQAYVLKYNGHQGRIRIYRVTNSHELGSQAAIYTHTRLRGTNIDIAGTFPVPSLFVHDPFTGTVSRFRLENNGTVDFDNILETRHAAWRDKNLFEVYQRGNVWSLFAIESMTGRVAIGNVNGAVTATADWTGGYTSVDHLTADGSTFRLLYKSAGHPYLTLGDPGEEEGRFIVQRVGADGLPEDETQRLLIPAGFTHLRFLTRPRPGQSTQYSILAYNRKTQDVKLYPFLVPQGLGVFLAVFDGSLDRVTSDVQSYVFNNEPRLLMLADDNVRAFAPGEVERMAHDIHNALQDKVVGYQLMVAQSGRVIYSRPWGISKHGPPDTAMTIRTRQDLGSVSKMITTMTAMKLAEQGTGGFGLNSRAALFLPGAPASGWTHDRNVADLLRHTTGVNENGSNECTRQDGYRMECNAFYSSDTNVDCKGAGCARSYNNSNTVAVRKMIEHLTNTSTSAQIVAETHDLWARRAKLDFDDGSAAENNSFSCRVATQTNYYGRCQNGASECFARNGVWWHQSPRFEPGQVWSINCSAGAWQVSSRQMIEFLIGIRYHKFLNESMTDRLVLTEDFDAYGNRTAIGWEPAWDAGDTRQLGKNGYDPTGPVATRAYITRLPENAEAVLLINTASPGVDALLQAAYRRAKVDNASDREPLPNYIHVVATGSGDTPNLDGADRVAIGTLTNGAPGSGTFNTRHVVAGRDSADRLKLTVWRVDERGGTDAHAAAYLPGTVKDLALSHGDAFATAVIAPDDRLRVDAWNVNPGNLNVISRQGSATGPFVRRVAITKSAGEGLARGRVVTAAIDDDNSLQVQAWDFDNQSDGVVKRGNHTGTENMKEVAIATLDYGNTWSSDSRVVTAVKTGANRLTVEVWNVSGAGVVERASGDTTNFEVAIPSAGRKVVAIGRLTDATFYVAFLNDTNKLKLLSYRVNNAGVLTREGEFTTSKSRSEIAAAGTVTLARNEDGDLEIIQWHIGGPNIAALASDTYGAVDKLAVSGNVMGAFIATSDKTLRVRNWDIVR